VFEKDIHIFARCDASKENDVAVGRQRFREPANGFLERLAISRIAFVDVNGGEFPQIGQGDCRLNLSSA